MKRTSTPDHEFKLSFSYSEYIDQLLLTYTQNGKIILEFTEKDIGDKVHIDNDTVIRLTLSQEDTSKFAVGEATAELKLWTKNQKSLISKDINLYVQKVQNEKVFT